MSDTLQIIQVRVPELPRNTDYRPQLQAGDLVLGHLMPEDKTVAIPIEKLRAYVITDGGLSHVPPIVSGTSWTVEVTEAQAGGTIFSIPELAGFDFVLRRPVIGAIPSTHYEILNAGGFKLTGPDMVLQLGEVWELQLMGSQAPSAGGGSGTGGGSSSIISKRIIAANETLQIADLKKWIQIRANTALITLTLPDITLVPLFTRLPIEAVIGNRYQAKVQTSLDQKIYFKNYEGSHIWLGRGESFWIMSDEDGWYIDSAVGEWDTIGQPFFGYGVGDKQNQIILEGQELQRAQYPRLWERVQGFGASLVTDAQWNTVALDGFYNFKGCYSTGNGTSTFRVPDLRNMAGRGLKSNDGTPDASRALNQPGGLQRDFLKKHKHNVNPANANSASGAGKITVGGDSTEGNLNFETLEAGESDESTMKNAGFYWQTKY